MTSATVVMQPFSPLPELAPADLTATTMVLDAIQGQDGSYSVPRSAKLYDMVKERTQHLLTLPVWRKHTQEVARHAFITAVIPAHDEAESIATSIRSLLQQTRRVDKIVVMVNNSKDDTANIANAYRRKYPAQVVVYDVQDLQYGKVEALGIAWKEHVMGGQSDFALFVDADVVCHRDMLAQLEKELIDQPDAAGVRARYNFSLEGEMKGSARRLVMDQRHEFAQVEIRDYLRGKRTHILGGQATLFRAVALDKAAGKTRGNIPWDRHSSVEDSRLSDTLRELGYSTIVSAKARADVGAMLTSHALRQQRIKWTHGHISDALSRGWAMLGSHLHVWRQQVSMAWNLLLRLLFVTMLLTSVSLDMFVFSPWWLIPSALAVGYNTLIALKIPGRQPREVLRSILFFPDEIALWRTLSVWATSWSMMLPFISQQRDLWKRQRDAENSKKTGTLIAWLGMAVAVLMPFGAMMVLSGIVGTQTISSVVELGWMATWVMTGVSSVVLVFSIVRLLSRYREISLA